MALQAGATPGSLSLLRCSQFEFEILTPVPRLPDDATFVGRPQFYDHIANWKLGASRTRSRTPSRSLANL